MAVLTDFFKFLIQLQLLIEKIDKFLNHFGVGNENFLNPRRLRFEFSLHDLQSVQLLGFFIYFESQ